MNSATTALKANLWPPQGEAIDYPPELWLVTGKYSMLMEQERQVIAPTAKCQVANLLQKESKSLTRFCKPGLDIDVFNPLNAELNPICHLLVLLGDLTFMGPCIVSISQYTRISKKIQRYTVYLYLETALHLSGGIYTHHQERIQLYLQHLVFVTPLLLSAAIVEELEPV
jgi:hypothetical protein